MILLEDILRLHYLSIEDFGGSHGIRDEGLLLSAVNRPYQTFDGTELYPTPIEKAAALAESLIVNHPFIDGNKRIGLLGMLSLLKHRETPFSASQDELYDFIIEISTGEKVYESILSWLKEHTIT